MIEQLHDVADWFDLVIDDSNYPKKVTMEGTVKEHQVRIEINRKAGSNLSEVTIFIDEDSARFKTLTLQPFNNLVPLNLRHCLGEL